MKLYYTKGACSLVVRIVINELGLSSEYEAVDLKTKKTATGKDFLKINPKGAVPVLEIEEDEILTENAVIQQYLADECHDVQLLPELGNFKRYRVLEWLNYMSTELHKGFGIFFHPAITQEMKDKIFIPLMKMKLSYLDKHLQHHRYLLGEHFTLPDAYCFVMLTWAAYLKFNLSEWAFLSRYFSDLYQRKSIQQSLQEEGLQLSVV